MRRVEFKLMPDGHIRGFQSDTPDSRGVSEMQIYLPINISPTLTVAHTPKVLIADKWLMHALKTASERI